MMSCDDDYDDEFSNSPLNIIFQIFKPKTSMEIMDKIKKKTREMRKSNALKDLENDNTKD